MKGKDLNLQYVPSQKLDSITQNNHQGVIAYVSPVEYGNIEALVDELLTAGKKVNILVLDRITDVRNFGGIARTAECQGVDAILIETMSDLGEVEAAVAAAQEVAPGMPIIVTMSFDTNLRTMMGVKPAMAVKQLAALGVRIIGANCGRGTDEMSQIAKELVEARPEGVFIITQSNAGLPKLQGDVFIYDGTPEEMARYAKEMKDLGVNIVGSCCGSSPAHTKLIAAAIA